MPASNPETVPAGPLAAGWSELRAQRPLAAWAAWQGSLRLHPTDPTVLEALALLEGSVDLPEVARSGGRFLPPCDEAARRRWDAVLARSDLAQLERAAAAFDALVRSAPGDAEAWANLGRIQAWQGRNRESIAALEAAAASWVQREDSASSDQAARAWCLAELLRHGAGAETLADDVTSALVLDWPDTPEELAEALGALGPLRQVEIPGPSRDGATAWEWLDRPLPPARSDLVLDDVPRLRAVVIVAGASVRFSVPVFGPTEMPALERDLIATLGERCRVVDRATAPLPIALLDAPLGRLRLPSGIDLESRVRLTREWVEWVLESAWAAAPRTGLGTGVGGPRRLSPLDAAARLERCADPLLRAKLKGLVAFRAELASRPRAAALYAGYPFERLRARFGLEADEPGTRGPVALSQLEPSGLDLTALRDAVEQSADLDGTAGDRLASSLAERCPEEIAGRDYPRFGLRALRSSPDAAALLERARRAATTEARRGAIEALGTLAFALDQLAEGVPVDLSDLAEQFPAEQVGPARGMADALDELGLHGAAATLRRRALAAAIASGQPWPLRVAPPLPPRPDHDDRHG